jgi:hypothetical protein
MKAKPHSYAETGPSELRHEPLGNINRSVESKLYAINEMRTGDFVAAASSMKIRLSDKQHDALWKARVLVEEDFHQQNKGRASWSTYEEAAKILKEADL